MLQVLPALNAGGVERGTLEIAAAIVAAGGRAVVASAGGRLVAPLEALGATHVTMPLTAKSPLALWRNAQALGGLVRAERIDLLHARSRAPAWSSLWAARRTGKPFVTTYHGTYNEGLPGKRLYNSVMARGDRVIAISRFIADLIRARHKVDDGRIRLVPRGVDPARFDPFLVSPGQVTALRAAWGVPDGTSVVLLPGRITRWKGQTVLVDALARLPGHVVAVLLGEAGTASAYAATLRQRIAERRLGDRVRLPGHTEDVATALAAADIVVHASIEPEAFGRTVIEAQAMARPVIASDLGAPRETVRHGVSGWLVAPGDPAALATTIGRVLDMPPAERIATGMQARRDVLRHYTTAAMQAATLDIYRELVG